MSNSYTIRFQDSGERPDAVVDILTERIGLSQSEADQLIERGGEITHGLSGDEAVAIRRELEDAGAAVAIGVADAHDIFTVRGRVRLAGGTAVPNLAIVVKSTAGEKMGSDETDADGQFKIDYPVPTDEEPPTLSINAIDADETTVATASVAEPKPTETVDMTVGVESESEPRDERTVLRFATVRSPGPMAEVETIRAYQPVEAADDSLHKSLANARADGDRLEMIRLAAEFVASDEYISGMEDIDLPLSHLDTAVATREADHGLVEIITMTLDDNPVEVVERQEFESAHRRVQDSLVAASIIGSPAASEGQDLRRALRLLTLIERSASVDADNSRIEQALDATIRLPPDLFPLPALSNGQTPYSSDDKEGSGTDSMGLNRPSHQRMQGRQTTWITRQGRRPTDGTVSGEALANAKGELDRVVKARAEIASLRFSTIDEVNGGDTTNPEVPLGEGFRPETEFEADSADPERSGHRHFVVTETVLDELSEETRDVLEDLESDLREHPPEIGTLLTQLEDRAATLSTQLAEGVAEEETRLVRLGSEYYAVPSGVASIAESDDGIRDLPSDLSVVKHGVGIEPLGVGDLQVVRQHPVRYQMGELAHIESALAGESKRRTHRRTSKTEESIMTEQETLEESERDLQTSERRDLQTAAEKTIRDESSLEAGGSISASYGPIVEAKAHGEYASKSSREEATRTAVNYAESVVERTIDRVRKRVFERRSVTRTEEIEERQTHSIDNSDPENSSDHVTGIYRWVNAIHQAQVYTYDKRLLFEFLVPEPAAFFLESRITAPETDVPITKPSPPVEHWRSSTPGDWEDDPALFNPPLDPNDLQPWNYSYYVRKYDVPNITTPPEPIKYVSKTFSPQAPAQPKDPEVDPEDQPISNEASGHVFKLPEGYRAVEAVVNGSDVPIFSNPNSSWTFDVDVDGTGVRIVPGNNVHTIKLGGRVGELPVTVHMKNLRTYTLSVDLRCEPTDRRMEQWQLETYRAIRDAYETKRSQYEQQVKEAVRETGATTGPNPTRKRELERTELKKGVISLLQRNHIDIDAITDIDGIPEIDRGALAREREAVEFFEQAFEWGGMTYSFYPYFWARRHDRWSLLHRIDDADSQFGDFLRAGAARVVLPVRPGFESDALHFSETGQIWSGGGPPGLADDEYVSIATELRERIQPGGNPIGDPWPVTVPTTSVTLQSSPKLPNLEEEAMDGDER